MNETTVAYGGQPNYDNGGFNQPNMDTPFVNSAVSFSQIVVQNAWRYNEKRENSKMTDDEFYDLKPLPTQFSLVGNEDVAMSVVYDSFKAILFQYNNNQPPMWKDVTKDGRKFKQTSIPMSFNGSFSVLVRIYSNKVTYDHQGKMVIV